MWPPATNLAFRVKSILISNITRHLISWNPINSGTFPLRASSGSELDASVYDTWAFAISFLIESLHR